VHPAEAVLPAAEKANCRAEANARGAERCLLEVEAIASRAASDNCRAEADTMDTERVPP
jgi:hypothetical protein